MTFTCRCILEVSFTISLFFNHCRKLFWTVLTLLGFFSSSPLLLLPYFFSVFFFFKLFYFAFARMLPWLHTHLAPRNTVIILKNLIIFYINLSYYMGTLLYILEGINFLIPKVPLCENLIFKSFLSWVIGKFRRPALTRSRGAATRWQCFRTLFCLEGGCEHGWKAEGHQWQKVGRSDAVFIIQEVWNKDLEIVLGKRHYDLSFV